MENRRKVESWEVTYSCDACEMAFLKYSGYLTLENDKAIYHHECPHCNVTYRLDDIYPFNETNEVCKLKL